MWRADKKEVRIHWLVIIYQLTGLRKTLAHYDDVSAVADGFDFGYAMYELQYSKYLHTYICLVFSSSCV